MLYIKIIKNETVIAVEAHTSPVYVHKQPNGVLVRCSELKAQGILSVDGSVVYQLDGKEQLDNISLIASVITTTEYLNLVESLDELPSEDTEPDAGTEDNTSSEPVMTTTEMRERILALEEELAATKILLGVE